MRDEMEQIYTEYARYVYKFLFSQCHDEQAAEEMTQETFYRATYSLGRYDGSCKVSVWLCQIAKHVWYQELERRRKRGIEQPLYNELPDTVSDIEARVMLSADKAMLYKAIQTLPEAMKDVVHMRLTGEFTFAEIGEILGKSEVWARTNFYRAKQKLLEALS